MKSLQLNSFLKPVLVLAAGLILGVGATLVVGMLVKLNTHSSEQQLSNAPDDSLKPRQTDGEISFDNNLFNYTQGTLNNVLAEVEALADQGQSIDRFATLYALISLLNTQKSEDLLNRSVDSQWDIPPKIRLELQDVLLERLSMTSPAEAIEFVFNQKRSMHTLRPTLISIFADWSNADVESAIAKANTLPVETRKIALQGILQAYFVHPISHHRELADQLNLTAYFVNFFLNSTDFESLEEPELAWTAVIDVAEKDYFFVTQLSELAKQWYAKSGFNAFDQILSTMNDMDMKSTLIANVLRFVAESEPARALDYSVTQLTQLDVGWGWEATESVIQEWAIQDPRAALESISGLNANALKQNLQHLVVQSWANQDADYVLNHLSEFPRHTQSAAVASAITKLASESPDQAVSQVLRLDDANIQLEAAQVLVSIWSRNELEQAQEWVLEEPAINSIREHLIEPLAYAMVATDPSGAFELSLKHTSAEGQVGLEAIILEKIASQDVELALSLLPSVRDGLTKAIAFGSVGNAHVENSDFQKAIDLGLRLDESDHSTYFESISLAWINVDAERLFEVLPSLPNQVARSKAAYALSLLSVHTDVLTKKQIESLDQYLSEKDREDLGTLVPFGDP
ncbi:MAG: hypothetical protein F4W92_10280 [Gammaproteobacteria bacterium]|nr:hypothetical protein [Gammaproteobacteria bacterium]